MNSWRKIVFRLAMCALVVFSGCSSTLVGQERGRRLRTESRVIETRFIDSLRVRQDPTVETGILIIELVRERITITQSREIYELVEVYEVKRLAFQPEFFLWPVNIIRTPVGIALIVVDPVRTISGGLAAVVLIFTTFPVAGFISIIWGDDKVSVFYLGLIDSVFLPYDCIIALVINNSDPIYRYARETDPVISKELFDFAFDYKAYPFIVGTKTREEKRIASDNNIPGEWTRSEAKSVDPTVGIDITIRPRITGEADLSSKADSLGRASFGLVPIADRLAYDETLELTVNTPHTERPLNLRYPVRNIRPPHPPTIALVYPSVESYIALAGRIIIEAKADSEAGISRLALYYGDGELAREITPDNPSETYSLTIEAEVLLDRSPATFEILATDTRDRTISEEITILREFDSE